MGDYLPNTGEQRRAMLEVIEAESEGALYQEIPAALCASAAAAAAALPQGVTEFETMDQLRQLAEKNRVFDSIFRGAGAYWHYIPAVVSRMAAKEAFVTAYTPYQPELSQGILQAIFEFQTIVCELTGMDAANASVYDGASAAAEAAAMCRERGRRKTLLAAGLNPEYARVVDTYCFGTNDEIETVPNQNGTLDLDALRRALTPDVSCLILQSPNFFGAIEDTEAVAALVHAAGARLVVSVNPIAAALLRTPAECGADVAVGDGQPLGLPLGFGGPYLGFMACKKEMVRKLPGRIAGETADAAGRRCFVLTLQAREQHIRREKASSNICSNQALCALTAAAYCTAMGPEGMKETALACYDNAHALAAALCELPGVSLRWPDVVFFHEFLTETPVPAERVLAALEQRGILGGLPAEGGILWCATERNTRASIDALISAVKEAIA